MSIEMKNYDDKTIGVETMVPKDVIDLLNLKKKAIDERTNETDSPLDEHELAMVA